MKEMGLFSEQTRKSRKEHILAALFQARCKVVQRQNSLFVTKDRRILRTATFLSH
jgi:hypothetical protein